MNIDRYTYLLLAASLCFGIKSSAQGVCSSNALAPVFKQTFDSSKSSTSKTTVPVGFVTNYKFQNKNPLADGEYIVTPLVQNAQRGDWAVGGDHTGNLNGNMFLVNAGTGASRFFYQQVDNLCPGSVYSFSAWLLNANTISKTMPICDDDYVWPRVTFNIKNTSGTVLQSFTTDTLPLTKNTSVAPNWKQYGFQFALPSGTTSLILEMVDFYGGKPQCGNDLAIDDILFSACTPTTTITLSTGSSICSGTSTSITSSLVNSPFSNPAYQWQKSTDGGTTWNNIGTAGTSATSYSIASAVVADGGLYRVVVGPDVASLSSSTCTSASNTITLTVNPSPAVTVNSVSAICSGNTFSITSNATSGTTPYSYSWTGPNSFTSTSANPSIANIATANAGTYSLVLTDAKSCTATASTSVTVATTPVVAAITGNSGACAGTTISLSNATPGGTWSSDNTAVATVSSGGLVTLVSGGTATISYTVNNGSCSATATKVITSASVSLHPDVIECNNGITHFTSTDLYYGVSYSNSDVGNTYAWSITGGSFSYQGSSNSSSQYPSLQLLTGSTFQAAIQFTTHGVTCSDTQMIYKNTVAADTIQGSHDTTVCFTTGPIALTGKASPVTNTFSWTTSGSGVFSSPNTLNTTYTPSAADKAAGTITIFLSGASTLNSTGNCGTSTSIDSMILRIYPDNTGTNATQVICSNQAINFTPSSAIPGSTYSWISAVTAGTLTGNTTNGTGNIIDSLVNLSNTASAIVTYTITPYAFTPSNKTCTGTPFTFTVTANPKPAVGVTNNAAGICTGSSTDIRFNSSITGSTYAWSSVISSGAATGNSANATPSATNKINDVLTNGSNANATVRYRITAISPAGCSRTDSTEVIVYAIPTAANAGPDQALCDVTTTLLAANSPVLGTGNWALISGPSTPTFVSPSSASSSINGLVTGTYQLSWSITNGVCGVSSDTVIIVNAPQTVAGSVSANATVCEGINSGTLTLSGYTGSIIRWEASADGGATWPVVINNTTNTYSYANLNTTTLFRAVVQSGACSFANSNPAVITVNPVTVPGTLSSDAVVCTASNSGILTLSGYTGSIIRWESSTDNGSTWPTTINNTTNTYQYTNLTATTLFRVVVQSGNCSAANSNAVTITVSPQTIAGTVSASTTVCAGINNGTLTLGGYTGNILDWESSIDNGATWSTISNTTNSLTYTNLTATTVYRALVQSGACASLYSGTAMISVVQAVTVANAGTDQVLCSTTSASLNANTAVSGTGTWTNLAGNPTVAAFTNANDPTSTVNGLTAGVYQFVWTISNGLCADSKDTVQITVNPQTVPGTLASSATVCAVANTGTLSLTGYTGNIVRWESSADNGVTWINIVNTTSALTFNNLSATTQYRVAVQSGVCAPLYSNIVTITVLQAVTVANAGTDQVLCSTTSASLNANTAVSGTGTWTNLAGNPTVAAFTNANDPTSTVNGLTTGVYQFVWTISNGLCADSKDTVQITVNPQTVPGTLASSATVCAVANTGTLLLTGYTGNIVRWESSADNGTTWFNIINTTSALTFNNLSATTQYRVAVQSGVCAPLYSNIVTITVLQAVTVANAGTDQVLCSTTSASLNANTAVSGTGTWTNLAGNPTVAAFTNANDPTSTVNGLTTGVYQFVWTISNGLCADSKDTVQITVNPQTVPGTLASSTTVCAVANTGTLSLTGYTGNIVRWESSADNGVTWINIINTTSALTFNNLSATTQYRVAVQSGVCAPLYSNIVTITVLQAVTVANAGTDQVLCSTTSASLNANTAVSGTGTWTNLAGNPTVAAFTNANDPTSTVNGLTTGVYQFVWTISNGLCADSKDTVQITVNPQTVPGTLASSATVCAVANTGTLSLTGYTGNIVRWESSADNGVTWINIINTTSALTFNNLSATTQYRVAVQSGVCAPLYSNIVTITVLQAVTVANAGIDQALCNVGATTLAGNVPGSGTGTWTALAGNPSAVAFTNPNNPGTTVNGLIAGTYQFVWTVSNGLCADSKDTVQVIVYPATVPGVLAADATACATSNTGTLSLSGYLSSIVRWESSIDNGATWSNIANINNTFTYNDLPTTTKYRAYVQNAVCPALYSNIVTINILQPVTVAYAGSDTTVINGITSYKLNANIPVSGTGTWSVIPGGPSALSFINVSDPKTTVGGLTFNPGTPPTDGIYKLVWTVSNGYCAISRDTMQITVQPPTNPGVIGPDAVVCTNNNHGSLALSDYLGNILQWESSIDYGATWTVIPRTVGTNQDTLVYDNLTTTTLFRALVKNGVGLSLYSGIAATVTVLQLVTPANAGPDQNLCNSSSTTLAGNTPTSGTGTWSALAGNPTATSFSNAADPATVVNGMTNGTYNFVWSISNGICDDSKDTVSITIQLPTIAGSIAADATVCVTSNTGTLNISGFRGSIVNGEVSIDNGATWTVIPNTANKTSYTYNNLGTTSQFRAMVQNSVCPALYTNIVTIFVLPEASIANAGADQSLCNVTAVALSGNTPSSGTGLWSSLAGNPSAVTFTNPVDPATTVNGLIAGTYQFVWTISNALCADSKDTVQVVVHPPTVPGTLVADATVCATANNGTLALSGFVGSILRWESSVDNGGSWNNIANTTNNFVYNNLTATTLYRAYVQNAVCPAIYSNNVTINVVQPVTIANAGIDQSLCNVTAVALSGNTPSSGTGLWTSLAGNPSAVSFTNPVDPATTVNGLTAGTYQFVWTISNALCADSKDTVQVIVHPPTVAGTLVADATVCATANNGTLALSGFVGSILRWESSIDNGGSWNNIANTTNNFVYNNLTATTLYRAYVQNAICPAIYSNNVTINVVQPVTIANAGIDQSLCNVTAVALSGNTPSSGTGLWSSLAGNPSAVSFTNPVDPATTVNGLTAGTYQFVWTISNALCADSKDTVQVIVHPPTVAGTLVADATVCATANNGTLALSGFVGSILRWESSVDNGSSWNNIANTTNNFVYNNLAATTLYRAYVQNAVCPAIYSNNVTINVVQPVTIANAGIDQSLCNVTAVALSGNTPSSGTGLWSSLAGNPSAVTFTNPVDPVTTVNGLIAGTYQFVWTISNALCADSKDTVQVVVHPPTVPGTLVADATVCATANNGTLALSGFVGSILRWESSIDNGGSWNNIANTTNNFVYNNLTATTLYRAYVQNAVCPAIYSNNVTINVVQPVTIANAGTDQSLCNVTATTLSGNTPSSGTGLWSSLASNPSAVTFTNPVDPATTVNGLTAGTYQFVWTISNALCADSKDTVQVIVYPPTVVGTLAADAFVCVSGNGGTLAITGYTGSIQHWESSIDNGATWTIINQASATFTYTNIIATTLYRALVQSGNCNGLYTNTVTVHVYPASVGGKLSPVADTACATSNKGSLLLNGFTGTIMHWEFSTDKGSSWTIINTTDSTYTYTSLTATTWYRVLIQSGNCSVTYSDTAIITIDSPTVAGVLAGTAIVCNGENSGSLILSGRTGTLLHWESSADNGSTWTIIASTTDTLTYTNLTATTQYRALVKHGACAMQYSNVISITAIEPVTKANAGADQVLCEANYTTTLDANMPTSGAGKWIFISGSSTVSFANPALPNTTVTGLRTGTYRFAWTISNGICSNSADTVTIRVDKVVSGFNLSSINDCGKTTYQFINTSQSAFGIQSWKWYTKSGDTINTKNHSMVFTTEGLRDMSLTAQSTTGCTNTIEALYKVIVYEFPKANINAIASVCKSQFMQVSSDVSSKDSIAYMLWNLGNGVRAKDSVVTVQYVNDGNYTVKLTVATINRCLDSTFKQIAVHPIPAISITSSPVVCKGGSIELKASGAMNYIWTDDNNKIICDGCVTTRVNPAYNSRYKVIGYSEYGCSQIQTTDLRVVQPLKMIAAKGDTLCVGQSKQLFASGASSYTWYPETGLSNKNASSPIANPLATTSYHVIGKDNYNCFTDTAEVNVVVGRPTPINIGKDTVITAGSIYQLTAKPDAQDIRKWIWYSPVELSCRNCATPQVKISDDISIYCTAINIYGCASKDTLAIKTFCPATEIFIPNAFTPDGDGINDLLIVQGRGVKMIKSFRIFNRWGEIVFEKSNFLPGDPAYGWDGRIKGKPAPPDVFVYVAEVICEKGLPTIFKGNVAILK